MTDKGFPSCDFESNELILNLNLTIPGDVKAIGPVVDKVMWVVDQIGCAKGKEFEVETGLREALANAVIHGCKKDPGKKIEFVVACDRNKVMLIIVRDPGGGFKPEDVPSPIVGECLYEEHGRGIFLINELMDEVKFERGGAELRMRKK